MDPRIETNSSQVFFFNAAVGLDVRRMGIGFRYDGNGSAFAGPDSTGIFQNGVAHFWAVYVLYTLHRGRWLALEPYGGYSEVLDYALGETEGGVLNYYREQRGSGPMIGMNAVLRVSDGGRIRASLNQGFHTVRDRRLRLEYLFTNMGTRPGYFKDWLEGDLRAPYQIGHVGYFSVGLQLAMKDGDRLELIAFIGHGRIDRLLP